MPKKKQKVDPAANLAAEIETMTEKEAFAALELTKEIHCQKVKAIAQGEAAKKELVDAHNDSLKILKEELATEVTRKGLLEDHLKRLAAAS